MVVSHLTGVRLFKIQLFLLLCPVITPCGRCEGLSRIEESLDGSIDDLRVKANLAMKGVHNLNVNVKDEYRDRVSHGLKLDSH